MGDRGAGLSKAAWGSLCLPFALRAPLSVCTCASRRAEAGKGAHTVYAGGSRGTGGGGTVIQVLVTAHASPAAHAHAVKAAS